MTGELLEAAQWLLAGLCNPGAGPGGVGVVDGEKHVLLTLGQHGVLWLHAPICDTAERWRAMTSDNFFAASLAAGFDYVRLNAPEAAMKNCTGAGDTLVGAVSHAIAEGWSMDRAVLWGMAAAKLSVESDDAIPTNLGLDERKEALRAVCEANKGFKPAKELLKEMEQGRA